MEVPKERAIINTPFRHECSTLRKKYNKTHTRVVGPIDTFKSDMSALEDTDRGSVTYLHSRHGQLCQARGESQAGQR